MPNRGELLIKARTADEAHLPEKLAPGSYVHLSVVDTGLGMDAETLKRASEPFFSTKPMGKGSGLGLSMVHGLTLQSGGDMHIASRPNEGTSVSLWLPVARDPVSTDQALDKPGLAEVPRSASCSWTTTRLCSRRPRTCCANWDTKR